MKKTLIALAAVAATSAFAQSTATIDGAFRIGYKSDKASVKSITPDQGSGNAINVKVTEDLGGGLKATAMTQLRFDASNGALRNESGATGNAAGFHLAAVGIEGGFGGVQFGRIGFDQMWGFNPFGSNGAHVNPTTYAGATQNGQFRYTSPSFNGFKAVLGGALKANTNGTAGSNADSTHVLLTYANGPVSVAYVSEKVVGLAPAAISETVSATNTAAVIAANVAARDNGVKISAFGASYDLGVAKLMLISGNQKDAVNGTELAKGTSVSASIPFGAFTGKVGYLNDQLSTKDKTSVGVDYALSKRTTLEANTYKVKGDANQTYWAGVRHSF
nr:porin [uncultured Limnohabitans sp.]